MKSKQLSSVIIIFMAMLPGLQVKGQALSSIAANYWKDLLRLNPLAATSSGVNDYNDQLEIDISRSYFEQTILLNHRYLDSLKTINMRDQTIFDVHI